MWTEGMEHSQLEPLAEALIDSIGPRLTGSPALTAADNWLVATYQSWGVEVRKEPVGTWRGWSHGAVHLDMTAPRVKTLDAKILAWSPGTGGKPIEGDVVALPDFASPEAATAWLPSVNGKIVLVSAPEPTCREPQAFEALARPATFQHWEEQRTAIQRSWYQRRRALGQRPEHRLEQAGAIAVLSSWWSMGWGVDKVMEGHTDHAVTLDVSCEDYGMLDRLAEHHEGPRVRISAETQDLGTVPTLNVVAELPGTALPGEYVLLGAHLDSWQSAEGATDNGTGTLMMMEAMRILKATYPHPRRTILVGHWTGEEEGEIGSRAFAEDHPAIVDSLQVAFNQDNGTWRVETIEGQGLRYVGDHVARWVAQIPDEIAENIKLDFPGAQGNTGSDHVSFLCHGAPGLRLQSNYPDYRQYTWHTNRDTYDKIVFDDLKNNATLAAMLAYEASEDPTLVSRDRAILPPDPQTGQPRQWVPCLPVHRSYEAPK
jgi:carboxypeptidase Q